MHVMIMHVSIFLHIIIFFLFFSTISVVEAASAKHGCQSRCGNIEIPYPFGIGENCSWDGYYFNVSCNTSSNPPKPYLQSPYPLEVINFSRSQILVKNWELQWMSTGYGATDKSTEDISDYNITFYLSGSPYTLSDANQLTSFGCDDLAMVHQFSNLTHTNSGYACLPYCENEFDKVGSCPGEGCCQTSISKTDYIYVQLFDMHKNWNQDSKYRNCSFAFIGGVTSFTFNLSQLDDPGVFKNSNKRFMDKPLVWDWRISSSNCTNNSCEGNSFCVDSDARTGGYHCICNQGYQDNPYLSPGCHDINECSANNPCAEYAICNNSPGSYSCSCHDGYYGDGQRNGTGCTQVPPSHSKVAVGVGLGTGIGTVTLLSACFWLYKFHRKRKNKKCKEKLFKRNARLLQQQGLLEKTQIFTAKKLEKATDRFNTSRVLGTGGQGTVYKGMLSNGKIIAIKKSNLEDEKHVELFINEVLILSEIKHRNVVELLGCCLETQVPLLVYEFVSNGTLYDHIHDENNEFPLMWNLRLKIAVEVAGALAYLHSATSHSIFHRDIKSRNILLDEKYVAKVSDFGASMSIEEDQTHVTTQVIGTYGYIDPQYFQLSHFTEKSDVYSFGVVLVELLTTQKPTRANKIQDDIGLAARFLLCLEEGNLETILDTHVLEQAGKKEELVEVAKLAQRCLNLNGKERPTMKEVAITLESIRMSETKSSIPSTTLAKTRSEKVHLDQMPKAISTSGDDYTWTSTNNTISSPYASPLKIHTI